MARIRADLALTIAAAALVGLGTQFITTKAIEATNRPQEYMAVEITDGTIGARADEDTPRVGSITELWEQDGLFTIELGNIRHYQSVAATDDFYIIRLESDEYIAVRVLRDSIVSRYYENRYIMPMGQVVYEPVPDDVLTMAKRYNNLPDDTSFYLDMRGTHKPGVMYKPKDAKAWGENVFIGTTLVLAVVLWQIAVRFGLFPPLIPRREQQNDVL